MDQTVYLLRTNIQLFLLVASFHRDDGLLKISDAYRLLAFIFDLILIEEAKEYVDDAGKVVAAVNNLPFISRLVYE